MVWNVSIPRVFIPCAYFTLRNRSDEPSAIIRGLRAGAEQMWLWLNPFSGTGMPVYREIWPLVVIYRHTGAWVPVWCIFTSPTPKTEGFVLFPTRSLHWKADCCRKSSFYGGCSFNQHYASSVENRALVTHSICSSDNKNSQIIQITIKDWL